MRQGVCTAVSPLQTSPSIVGDYYQLFNYSDDIYQGQLYGAASCGENGLSVLLLHLQAGESSAQAEAVQVMAGMEDAGGAESSPGLVPSGIIAAFHTG